MRQHVAALELHIFRYTRDEYVMYMFGYLVIKTVKFVLKSDIRLANTGHAGMRDTDILVRKTHNAPDSLTTEADKTYPTLTTYFLTFLSVAKPTARPRVSKTGPPLFPTRRCRSGSSSLLASSKEVDSVHARYDTFHGANRFPTRRVFSHPNFICLSEQTVRQFPRAARH